MIKNLLYFIYPLRPKNGSQGVEWRLNVEELSKYRDVFNGRKLFVIAFDALSEDPIDVQREIRSTFPDAWFWHVPNDKQLGEVAGFMPALELLESTDPNEATFYAHAKGVSYEDKPGPRERVREWRHHMYRECLGDIPKVELALQLFPCAGCFKKYGPWNPFAGVTWHYSGTYFWLKHSALFSKPDWRFIYQDRFGVEVYPSTHFKVEEGFCLYEDNFSEIKQFQNWVSKARTELNNIIAESVASKEPSISVIIPTAGRDTLHRVLLELHHQLGDRDEILVVGDGPCPKAAAIAAKFDARVRYLEYPDGPAKDWGHTPRNWSLPHAKGSHIFHLDDDDACMSGALENIRKAVKECPGKLLIFRTKDVSGSEIGGEHELKMGSVSTQMFVVPNIPERTGTWVSRYGGDFDFIQQCIELHPEGSAGVVWREELLAIHNGHGV